MVAPVTVNPHQFPVSGQLFLDHAAWFVEEFEASGAALERLGFIVTPLRAHMSALRAGDPIVPLGTANRCVMLRSGFLEMLGSVGDTPMAAQLRAQLARYPGLHLAAFSGHDAAAHHAALVEDGLDPLPIATIRRNQATPDGEQAIGGSIIRLAPTAWPEGRVQIVFPSMSPDALWHPALVQHANGADRLSELLIVVEHPRERADAFARFTRRPVRQAGKRWVLDTERGRVHLTVPTELPRHLPGVHPPALPYIAAVAIGSTDLTRSRAWFRQQGVDHDVHRDTVQVGPADALGATLVFHDRVDDHVFDHLGA